MNTTEEEGMVGMNEKEKKYYDNFVRAVLSLQNEEEVKEFFEDICTIKEIQDICRRLEVANVRTRRLQSGIGKAKGRG